ncbi:class I SAM-dependent methyltransferase [Sutcliffiella deserti]|uniref:class I SAM-dependent methyltransferase n=1 Tax=Sutcliffiella deserti TaxID=2875501 RepID=UPI001CC07E0F|nr:class I SAM-dependent methyltransferase [Sutcliffiella deserti]
MLNFYSKLSSEVYDIDKPIGHSFGDVEYYIERLAGCDGLILEPATGTGRILIPLLQKGFDVVGFDISEDMLELCRANCEKRNLQPNIFLGEMENFSIDQKFEAIIVPTGTFLLLYNREKSIQALKNFYHHLEDGGRLIVDIFLESGFKVGEVSTRTWTCENGDTITLQSSNVEIDHVNQHTRSHGRYEKWRNGALIQTELEPFTLRWYGVEEFKMVLEQTGFEDIVISADYKFGEYPTTANQVITFEAVAAKSKKDR